MRGDEERNQQEHAGLAGRAGFDNRLDTALRSYADPAEVPDARVALAQILTRIPAQLPTDVSAHPRRHWGWAVLATGVACALGMVLLFWLPPATHRTEIALRPAAPSIVRPPRASAVAPATPRIRPVHAALREKTVPPRGLPKLDVFPAPQPLSPQEQALVAFAKHGPPAVQRAVMEDQKHWDDPMIVAELEKRPQQGAGNENE